MFQLWWTACFNGTSKLCGHPEIRTPILLPMQTLKLVCPISPLKSGHLTIIRTPHYYQDTSLLSGHLTIIRTPHYYQDTSLLSGHLTIIRTPHYHQDTSLLSGHLTIIRTPHYYQDTFSNSVCIQGLYCIHTSLTSRVVCSISDEEVKDGQQQLLVDSTGRPQLVQDGS